MKKKNTKKQYLIKAFLFALIVGIIMLVVVFLTYKKETVNRDTYETGNIVALVCTSSDTESGFFDGETAGVEHKIKAMFIDDEIGKMSYEYNGLFNSKEAAEHGNAVLHARYNIYMSEYNIGSEKLNPVFQVSNNRLRIDLFLDLQDEISSAMGKIFYIDNEDFDSVTKYSLDEMKDYYEKKSFSCKRQD